MAVDLPYVIAQGDTTNADKLRENFEALAEMSYDGTQGAHIADANGTLADITTKFNTLLATLETMGILASS